jgi:hypothetical protein
MSQTDGALRATGATSLINWIAVRKILVATLLALLLAPALALADGDPASDVLLGENVFYPYQPPTSNALQKQLNAVTDEAQRQNFQIKVALIASPVDLGVIPDLFNKPEQYAKFLDQEISFQNSLQHLLVVMPAGYGVQGFGAPATQAVSALPKPAGKTSDDLAQAAITAVTKLAAASGHPLKAQAATTPTSKSGTSRVLLLVILVVAAIVVAGALIALRRRQATARP